MMPLLLLAAASADLDALDQAVARCDRGAANPVFSAEAARRSQFLLDAYREQEAIVTERLAVNDQRRALRETPPVPTTSISSKSDGIVSWRGCIERRSDRSESVEVGASHLGMGTHPEVLRILANRLAQPEGQWRPLRRGERLGRTRLR